MKTIGYVVWDEEENKPAHAGKCARRLYIRAGDARAEVTRRRAYSNYNRFTVRSVHVGEVLES